MTARLRDDSGEGMISALILIAGVLLPLLFVVPLFARLEQGRLIAEQTARDAVRAAVEAPSADSAQQAADAAAERGRSETSEPLQLTLDGTFARGATLSNHDRPSRTRKHPVLRQPRNDPRPRQGKRARGSVSQPRRGQRAMIRERLGDERGVVLIAGLLLTVALLMVIGTAVDIGNAFIVHRQLVNIADDAVLAGSQQLDLNALHQGTVALDPAQAQNAALATLNGDENLTASAQARSRCYVALAR